MNMETNQTTGYTPGTTGAPPHEGSTKEKLRDGAGEAKRNISQKTRETVSNLKEGARETTAQLKSRGSETAHQLQDQSRAFAETRKAEVAGKISGCGAAVRRAAEKLREENDPNIAEYAELVADRFERAGDYVQTRDFGSMFRDIENMARRRPEILFGGMFVAGLAISRFFKASEHHEYHEEAEGEDYWVEDDYDTEGSMAASMASPGMGMTSAAEPVGAPGTGAMSEAEKPGWPSTAPAPGNI